MADRPIIFSAPMVRALLDGRKTQTRLVLKPQPENASPALWPGCCRPYYAPGDRLWVRETWAHERLSPDPDNPDNPDPAEPMLLYRASYSERRGVFWRSPIHMPRWASRITLTVTDVRVQRVQEINEDDAAREGFPMPATEGHGSLSPMTDFAEVWDDLHGHGSWASDPWVAAITFRVKRCNIDGGGDR